jgi:hypothetical protein
LNRNALNRDRNLPWPDLARWAALLAGLWLGLGASAALAQAPDSFMRLAEDAEGEPRALQVALAHYRDAEGRILHLVGAIHVADREYFQELQRRFDDYDVVLYELVGDPEGGEQRPAGTGLNLVGAMQGGMKEALGLAFQLEEIDYEREHFVHADMTAVEFTDSMKSRDESWAGTFFQLWAASAVTQDVARQNARMIAVLFADDRQLAFKRMMAESMIDQARVLEVLADEDGSVLITERNRKALDVFERELEGGARNLALFYGAGHLPDFHRRLTADYGFELETVEWLDAWDLSEN